MPQSSLSASKIAISISFGLSVFATFVYLFPHQNGKHFLTPFSCTPIVIILYWLITLMIQFLFIVKVFFNENVSVSNQSSVIAIVGPHFVVSNVLHFFWCYFFIKEKFFISEIIVFINVLNLLMLYFTHKTISIKNMADWLTIHLPVTGLPLAWALYAVFWNGACLFHSHNKSLFARILANIFIWEFLLVPISLLLFHSDWSIGLATSFLMLGVGFSQLFTKLIALQWIFAFTIAGIDFVFSILSMFNSAIRQVESDTAGDDQAPLLA